MLAAQFLTGQGSKFPTLEEAARHRFTPTEADFIGTLRNGQLITEWVVSPRAPAFAEAIATPETTF